MSADTPRTKNKRARVAWVAGMRGEFLLMGPTFKAMRLRHNESGVPLNWLLATGENGMAGYQALDTVGLIPDESAPLCHPAEDLTVRLNSMLARVEAFGRQHKVTHIVFSGYGPTATAAAIFCHSRGCHGLWLRPPDPAGLIPRLRWEAGLERLIRACAPCVEILPVPAMPDLTVAEAPDPVAEVPGLRREAPLVLVAVERRNWGMLDDSTRRLALTLGRLTTERPEVDCLVISNLNARIEGPLRSLESRPANFLLSPPLPYDVYHGLLARASVLVTDSPMVAAEGVAGGRLVVTLADEPAEAGKVGEGRVFPITPADMGDSPLNGALGAALDDALGEGPDRCEAFSMALSSATGAAVEKGVTEWLAATSN